jgi:putative DNA primase/helicase
MANDVGYDGWKSLLTRTAKGNIASTLGNAQLILTNDKAWEGVLSFDEFIGDIVTRKPPPWPKDLKPHKPRLGEWTDDDTLRAAVWIERTYGAAINKKDVGGALRIVAARSTYHPVREWLEGLKWDRKVRLDTFLVRIAGAADSQYVREVAKNFLIGAVARIYRPGEQVDSMPVFEGKQGVRKTSMLRELFGEEWFMSTTIEIGNKDSYQVLLKKWCVEFGELDALGRAEVTRIKQFISERVSRYRPSYGSKAQDFLRQCVFAGTTNSDEYLKDDTGARRFWPVIIPGVLLLDGSLGVDLVVLGREREQLFAEAVVRFKKKEAWHITDPDLIKEAAAQAESRRQVDPWEVKVNAWLREAGKGRLRRGVTTHEVLVDALQLEPGKLSRTDEMRAASVLRTCGLTKSAKVSVEGRQVRVYRHACDLHLVPDPQEKKRLPIRSKNLERKTT